METRCGNLSVQSVFTAGLDSPGGNGFRLFTSPNPSSKIKTNLVCKACREDTDLSLNAAQQEEVELFDRKWSNVCNFAEHKLRKTLKERQKNIS